MDHQTIGDITISNMHRRCLHEHRRCVTDVSSMCRRCVWDIFNLGVHRRMFADCSALFGDISPMVFGVETSGENFNACIEIFSMSRCLGEALRLLAYVADHSPNHWCMVALPWRCPNVCIVRASGGLKSFVGP